MKDSPLRNNLGIVTFIAAIVIGSLTKSFLGGIVVFSLINIIIAPIIKLLENKKIIKSTEYYDNLKSSNILQNHDSTTNYKWRLNQFREFWSHYDFKSLEEALVQFEKIMLFKKEIGLNVSDLREGEKISDKKFLDRQVAKSRLHILNNNNMDNYFDGFEKEMYLKYKQSLEFDSIGIPIDKRLELIGQGTMKLDVKTNLYYFDFSEKSEPKAVINYLKNKNELNKINNPPENTNESELIDSAIYLSLSKTHFQNKKYKESLAVLKKAIRIFPYDCHICFKMALGYYNFRQYDYAFNWIENAISNSNKVENIEKYNDIINDSVYTSLKELYIKVKLLMESKTIEAKVRLYDYQIKF